MAKFKGMVDERRERIAGAAEAARQNTGDGTGDSEGDAVGYCRPPKHSQFKKGESGNPKGRPRKEPPRSTLALVQDMLDEQVEVIEGGKKRRITKREAAVRKAVHDVAVGKAGSVERLEKLCAAPFMAPKPSPTRLVGAQCWSPFPLPTPAK